MSTEVVTPEQSLEVQKTTGVSRRWFLLGLGAVFNGVVGSFLLAPIVRYPFRREWDGETAGVACYVRRTAADKFQVFAVNCAHLGCPVRWFPQSQLFMCPCHGGAYYADGARASGPPERGLFTYEYKIVGSELHIDAGQMPTLSNVAKLVTIDKCKENASSDTAKLVTIEGCKGNTPCGS